MRMKVSSSLIKLGVGLGGAQEEDIIEMFGYLGASVNSTSTTIASLPCHIKYERLSAI